MFFGGTNFGFMNSESVITSYDYDAPLTEGGDYGDKYWKAKQTIGKKFINFSLINKLKFYDFS